MSCDYSVSLGWRGGSRVGGLNFITLYPVGPKHDRASPPYTARCGEAKWSIVRKCVKICK